jgi:hypothetical protein
MVKVRVVCRETEQLEKQIGSTGEGTSGEQLAALQDLKLERVVLTKHAPQAYGRPELVKFAEIKAAKACTFAQ